MGEEGNERVTQKTVTLRLWLDTRSVRHVIRWRCVWTIMGFCAAAKLYGSSSNRSIEYKYKTAITPTRHNAGHRLAEMPAVDRIR